MENIILNSNATHNQQMHLSFALGKAYEDIKSYEKAFSYWKRGNFLKKEEIKYSSDYQTRLVQLVKQNFTKDRATNLCIRRNKSKKCKIFV